MKIGIILIVANGEPYIKQWIDHYSRVTDNIGIACGFTDKFSECGFYPDGTLGIITGSGLRYDFGIYKDKTSQQNKALSLLDTDTDYIIIADVDEFIKHKDIERIKNACRFWPDMITVNMNHFWKGSEYVCKGGDGWAYDTPIPRVFKYTPGCFFTDHRPITLNTTGNIKHHLTDVFVDHYSYVNEKMVHEKMEYYAKIYPYNADKYKDWFINCWQKWTPENRERIEQVYSVHPSCSGAKTERYGF